MIYHTRVKNRKYSMKGCDYMRTYRSHGRIRRTPENIEDISIIYNWCEEYIKEFIDNEGFDPLAALQGNESKHQRIYGLCVDFICNMNDLTEEFIVNREKVIL